MKRITLLFILLLFFSFDIFAAFDDTHRLEHSFNANTYNSNEWSLSIYSGARYGITDRIEVGTNLSSNLTGLYNFMVKNKLYEDDKLRFAINGYLFYINDEYISEEFDSITMPFFFNSSFKLLPKLDINGGIIYLFNRSMDTSSKIMVNLLGAHAGADFYLSKHSAFTMIAGLPFYASGSLSDSFSSLDISSTVTDPTENIPFYLSYNYSLTHFNLEIGTFLPIFTSTLAYFPLLSLYWRF